MRTLRVVQVLSLAVIVAAGAIWMKSRTTAAGLQARIVTLKARRNTVRALEGERDRLRAALAAARRLRSAAAPAQVPAAVQPVPPAVVVTPWRLGESRSAREWRNEGQGTPRGTVATLLWAAAGGDLTEMMRVIAFDEAARKQAQAVFDALSPTERLAFPTPETLVAALTIQAVPASSAQLSWFHQRDVNHATVGLLLGAHDQTTPGEVLAVPAQDNRPTMLVDNGAGKFAVLSLERFDSGWRVVVPAAAIERLARQVKPPAS